MKKEKSRGLLRDVFRKVPLGGEIKIPGDVRKAVVANIENLRDGVLDVFASEISKVLERVDFQRIIDQVLKDYTLKVEAKIELQPKSARGSSSSAKGGTSNAKREVN